MKLQLTALALLSLISNVRTDPLPASFHGHPIAESGFSKYGTTLFYAPVVNNIGDNTPRGRSSARFYYTKNYQPADSQKVKLATVYLKSQPGQNIVAELQNGFDIINQECSCYWLDAKDLKTRFPNLQSGSNYYISFKSDNYLVDSGTFAIDLST